MRRGDTGPNALRDTVRLAEVTESLGYRRFWVAEHHSSRTFVGTSPEILSGHILSATSRIRVGSGGVLLSHYSPLKIAEQFRTLESLHPGRVDLGIGRAPGGSQHVAEALANPRPTAKSDDFPQQVADLANFLHGTIDTNHQYSDIRVQPGPSSDTNPEIWLLGSSDVSAKLAASLGLSYAYADFFGDIRDRGPAIVNMYREEFKPSNFLPTPRVIIALQLLCAPSGEEAEFLGSSRNLNKASGVVGGLPQGLLPPEEASIYPRNAEATEWETKFRQGYIDGSPEEVKQKVLDVVQLYAVDEVSLVTITYDIEHKLRSYELVSEVFGLTSNEGAAP